MQTDEVQRAKEWQIRLESENHAVSRQAEAQVLTSPPPSTPSPFLACPSLRSVAAVPDVLKARQQPTPAHTHARTHAVWLQSQKRTELELLAQAMRQARPPPKSPHLRACHSLR